jgi:hypothetical protein
MAFVGLYLFCTASVTLRGVDAFLSTGRFPDTLKRLRLFKEAGYQTTNLALRVRARSSPLPDHTGHSVHLARLSAAVQWKGVRPSASHRRIRSWWDRYLQSRWRAVLSPHCLCESSAKRIPFWLWNHYWSRQQSGSLAHGRVLAYLTTTGIDSHDVWIVATTGTPRSPRRVTTASHALDREAPSWSPSGHYLAYYEGIPSGKDPHVLRWLDSRDSSYRRHPACTRAASEVYPERKPERIRLRSSSDPCLVA